MLCPNCSKEILNGEWGLHEPEPWPQIIDDTKYGFVPPPAKTYVKWCDACIMNTKEGYELENYKLMIFERNEYRMFKETMCHKDHCCEHRDKQEWFIDVENINEHLIFIRKNKKQFMKGNDV